jgi:flagellar basal-body rod protein FlgG
MQAQTATIDVIANNLSNVNTAGFKRNRAEFQDLLYETLRPPGVGNNGGNQMPSGIQIGHGTRLVATHKVFVQGNFENTQNDLDIAIEGQGFFQIAQPNGDLAYTRAGNFKIDSEGRMVTPDGYLLNPEITIPTDALAISISPTGSVSVLQPGNTTPSDIGTIQLARFINPAGLENIGRNLYTQTNSSGEPLVGDPGEDGYGTLAQGYLEKSNVSVVDEMVNMITAQRAYEINSKAIQTADDMLLVAKNFKR